MIPANDKKPFLINGLNGLEKKLKEKGMVPSRSLLLYIERQMIGTMIASKVEPSPENMNREYERQAHKYSGEVLMYRHFAQKQADQLVARSMDDLRFKEQRINELREMEFEPSLQKLRGKNESANSEMASIGALIKQTKGLLDTVSGSNHTAKFSLKSFEDFVDKSDVLQASETLFESMASSLKDQAVDFLKPTAMKAIGL